MPSFVIGLPSGPIANGMTYIVRPFMQPAKRPFLGSRRIFLSLSGAIQWLVGPASISLAVEMNVRPSTRATSDSCERAR